MPSRILEMIKAKVSQLPKEVPKPQKPVNEPKIKNIKKTNIKLEFLSIKIYNLMSSKSIRNMQIQEFLNRYKNIASIVADSVRHGVSRFEPVVDPARREQLNMLEIQNVG